MADAPGVHELGEDDAAVRVDGVGDVTPGGDLDVTVEAGCVEVALADDAGLGAFGDDEAGGGALGVVERGVGGGGEVGAVGATAGHGGHDDAIGEGEATEGEGGEGGGH